VVINLTKKVRLNKPSDTFLCQIYIQNSFITYKLLYTTFL